MERPSAMPATAPLAYWRSRYSRPIVDASDSPAAVPNAAGAVATRMRNMCRAPRSLQICGATARVNDKQIVWYLSRRGLAFGDRPAAGILRDRIKAQDAGSPADDAAHDLVLVEVDVQSPRGKLHGDGVVRSDEPCDRGRRIDAGALQERRGRRPADRPLCLVCDACAGGRRGDRIRGCVGREAPSLELAFPSMLGEVGDHRAPDPPAQPIDDTPTTITLIKRTLRQLIRHLRRSILTGAPSAKQTVYRVCRGGEFG